ncbi:phosphotransferase [Crocosphaera sp. XPORK-15E]|uniref:phosphotransferase n=1 Tax=Crocosphaera sp. XPORK-15E TaxID=3110247 RepID=UPI002B219039|nr:phosphotransferase [Crocosphaera sp. XPORK-15E]MEA5535809.1 phosphotransferase [Crocosphaera sp. XPORK-15E]
MSLILNSQNIFDYLIEHRLFTESDKASAKIEPILAKNFNLLISFSDNGKLLVKQERHNQEGKTAGEFLGEWRLQKFLQDFSELNALCPYVPEIVHFDQDNSILICNYLEHYRDLADFYAKEDLFAPVIASSLGTILAIIHRQTFNNEEYKTFFSHDLGSPNSNPILKSIQGLEKITPEIFGVVPTDGLKFFALYQRYDSLGKAIAELGQALNPICLTHNDLKLNNILLSNDWQESDKNLVRLIDWERSGWGDPAFDLGMLMGGYIQIWLGSLVISQSLTIDESLRLATTPLELLQPSIAALYLAYFHTFPEIIEHKPDFLKRVIQCAGFALIGQIQAMIQYQKSFGNTGIAMLQVAKTLLSRPTQSIPTLFGSATSQLPQPNSVII